MAKSSRVVGLDRVRGLFKSAEQAVLESTAGKKLLAASRAQLDRTLAQARSLRDKWRDLYAQQTRSTKRSARSRPAANARTRAKSDMFTAAIGRIQSRLADMGLAPAAAAAGAGSPRPGKTARRAGHRSTRASVKAELAAAGSGGDAVRSPRRAGGKKPRSAVAVAAAAPARAAALAKGARSRRPAKGGTKRAAAKSAAVPPAKGTQAVRFDVAKQRKAKASATAARLRLDGKATRRGGHALASGKRRQAARDRRGG